MPYIVRANRIIKILKVKDNNAADELARLGLVLQARKKSR